MLMSLLMRDCVIRRTDRGQSSPATELDVLLRDHAIAAAVASCTAARAACRLVPLPPPSAESVRHRTGLEQAVPYWS